MGGKLSCASRRYAERDSDFQPYTKGPIPKQNVEGESKVIKLS